MTGRLRTSDNRFRNLFARSLVLVTGLVLGPPSIHARPVDPTYPVIEIPDLSGSPPQPSGVLSLSSASFLDTVYYGGTRWAPDSLRWEALKDSVWTFDTGVGSSINTGFNANKPTGYHQTMEGWFGIDETLPSQPFFRRSSTCAISGSFSAWAGVTLSEASALCYAGGQGYGNSWNLYFGKSFSYPGAGDVTLNYKYAVNAEAGFDYSYIFVDTTGAADPTSGTGITIASYTGAISGTDSFLLQRGVSMRSNAGPIRIWFNVTSDGSYSDEDGLFSTACGHSAFDDITLSGAISDVTDFEAGANGWSAFLPATGIGDFSSLMDLNNLPAPATFCPCSLEDSVLVLFNQSLKHPSCQENIAVSPWIDLKRGGDISRSGRLMSYEIYSHNPVSNYLYTTIKVRYYPYTCPVTGTVTTSPFLDGELLFYFGEGPFCTAEGTFLLRDFSSLVNAGAEQVQIAFGVIEVLTCFCCFDGPPPTPTNSTPWYDNIRFGVYGPSTAPIITMATSDQLQDSFATDGTLFPASTGRLDASRLKNASTPSAGARMSDTLVARGDGGNTEVRIVFQVRPGPFSSTTALLNRAARWTPEPSIPADLGATGGTWYSARLDTARQGGSLVPGVWMAAFHEADPGFLGTDRTPDPMDPSELENEILPDHILTPGSRVDYFVQSRYIPPDPRNVGGMNWFITPDTGGRHFLEAEILPSSMDEDTTWNCTLYVDHHDDRETEAQSLEESGLSFALGSGGSTAEGTRFDRYDTRTPTQISLGRPANSNMGASLAQMFGYRTIAWHTGASLASGVFFATDAALLKTWLLLSGTGGRNFWGSGTGFAQAMTASNNAVVIDFMNNILGVTRTCNTIRDANCPSGTALDSTNCLPLGNVAGQMFPTALPANAGGNGCRNLRSFDLLGLYAGAPAAMGQLDYVKNGTPASFASVTNEISASGSKTVIDGFAVAALRTASGDLHNAAYCTDAQAALLRSFDVLGWFGSALICRGEQAVSAVPGPGPGGPVFRTSLSAARPNPTTGRTTIAFVNAVENGRVTLQIFDVTGRLVRTLLDAPMTAGSHEVTWDGGTGKGSPAAAGLYFYRLTAGDYSAARRLILVK